MAKYILADGGWCQANQFENYWWLMVPWVPIALFNNLHDKSMLKILSEISERNIGLWEVYSLYCFTKKSNGQWSKLGTHMCHGENV
jgi:hypothetical protein